MNRRNVLAILGLASTTAIGAETFVDAKEAQKNMGGYAFGGANKKSMADALRALADEIEGDRILPQKIDCHSSLKQDDFMFHTITLELATKVS